MAIEFTQYMLPDGRTKQIHIDRPSDIEEKARAITNAGFHFECEFLTTGEISFTIADREKQDDVALEFSENGPEVLDAVDKLITDFHTALLREDL